MSYNYTTERPYVFTDEGQRTFLKVRDNVKKLLAESGTVRMDAAMRGITGDTWETMACVDRMVELGEIREVPQPAGTFAQYRIFVSYR